RAAEGRGPLLRAGVAESRDRAVDESRVDHRQRLVAEPELVHHTGAEVFPYDVARPSQPLDDLDRLRLPEIERDAALVAVHGQEAGRHLAVRPLLADQLAARLVPAPGVALHH